MSRRRKWKEGTNERIPHFDEEKDRNSRYMKEGGRCVLTEGMNEKENESRKKNR